MILDSWDFPGFLDNEDVGVCGDELIRNESEAEWPKGKI